MRPSVGFGFAASAPVPIVAVLLGLGLSVAAPAASAQTLSTDARTVIGSFASGHAFVATQWGDLLSSSVVLSLPELPDFPARGIGHSPMANGFFDASQYAADCSAPVFVVDDPGGRPLGTPRDPGPPAPALQVHLCSATAVPAVGISFLTTLRAAGLHYHLVYPIQDNGNGHAYVVWNADVVNEYSDLNLPSTGGYARIEGAGWQDQFVPATVPTRRDALIHAVLESDTYAHGDGAGDFISALASPLRATTLRIEIPCIVAAMPAGGICVTMLSDNWLGASATPPLPPAPSVANGPPPPPLNVGQSGNPYAQGQSGQIADGVQKDSGFNFVAFCNAAANNGKQRSAAFIEACLAKQ